MFLFFNSSILITSENEDNQKLIGDGWELIISEVTLVKKSGELYAPDGKSLLILSLKANYQKGKKKNSPRVEDAKITNAETSESVMSSSINVKTGAFKGVIDNPMVFPKWKKRKRPKKYSFICCISDETKNLNFELPNIGSINLKKILKSQTALSQEKENKLEPTSSLEHRIKIISNSIVYKVKRCVSNDGSVKVWKAKRKRRIKGLILKLKTDLEKIYTALLELLFVNKGGEKRIICSGATFFTYDQLEPFTKKTMLFNFPIKDKYVTCKIKKKEGQAYIYAFFIIPEEVMDVTLVYNKESIGKMRLGE